jgi:solute carrier family 25 oxoglutarate transporter 11
MQADGMLPEAERRGYNNVFAAFSSIVKNEGVGGLFAGAVPTATRAMALNLGMLGGNQVATEQLKAQGLTGPALVVASSAIAGFLASAFSLPFDFVKTQMQKQKPDPVTGELPFGSAMDCVMKTMKEGGPLRFYAGFPTFYVRIAPHAMITLIAQDKLKAFWKSQGML